MKFGMQTDQNISAYCLYNMTCKGQMAISRVYMCSS